MNEEQVKDSRPEHVSTPIWKTLLEKACQIARRLGHDNETDRYVEAGNLLLTSTSFISITVQPEPTKHHAHMIAKLSNPADLSGKTFLEIQTYGMADLHDKIGILESMAAAMDHILAKAVEQDGRQVMNRYFGAGKTETTCVTPITAIRSLILNHCEVHDKNCACPVCGMMKVNGVPN
jgi:hypothetical protein